MTGDSFVRQLPCGHFVEADQPDPCPGCVYEASELVCGRCAVARPGREMGGGCVICGGPLCRECSDDAPRNFCAWHSDEEARLTEP